MKKISLLLFMNLALMSFSCSEKEEPIFAVVDMMTFITVLDEKGNNLLDPSNEDSFKAEDIKIFYERDGVMKEFFEGNLDMPRNFRIDPPELGSDYLMAIALDAEKTVIQWNEDGSDTIQAEIQEKGQSIVVVKVFQQGELKHDTRTSMTRREFTIIK